MIGLARCSSAVVAQSALLPTYRRFDSVLRRVNRVSGVVVTRSARDRVIAGSTSLRDNEVTSGIAALAADSARGI